MNISDLLTPQRVACGVGVGSKKRALESLAGLLVKDNIELGEEEVFTGLIARERLGSTGLGHGVAIPHSRFRHIDRAAGALMTFEQGIDFDAPDGQPVKVMFALLVPENSTEEHLQLLAALAEMFGDAGLRDELKEATVIDTMISAIQRWNGS